MFRLIPREEKFFDLFKQGGELIVEGANEFRALLDNLSQSEARTRRIKDIEHRADDVTHKTIELLHRTFITPMDRDDIHRLITKMDDILDFLEAAAERIHLYDIKKTTPSLIELADICVRAAVEIQKVVQNLDNLKNPESIVKICVEINRLENEGDQALRSAMVKLFKEETDVRQLIKFKELYELLETVTDRCEDVANIIEGIILEYA